MVAAAAGIAASAASIAGTVGSMSSGGSTNNQSASNAPWGPQQPYLQQGFQQAQTNLQNAQAIPIPTSYVAGQNANQATADQGLFGTGMAMSANAAPWAANGVQASSWAPAQGAFAANLAINGIGSQSDATSILSNYAKTGQMPGASTVDPRLASSVTQAGISGLGSLGSGSSLSSQAGQMALNPNGTMNAATAGATALSQNPGLDAAIDAANRDTNRDLTENTLPQMRAAAMSSGNANSSREGAMEAIATRGAADRMSDTAATMRLGAYTQGANLGATGYNSGLSTAVNAGNSLTSNGATAGSLLNTQQGLQQSQSQFDTSSQLSAANNAASQDLSYQNAQFQAQLAGNSQFGQSIQNAFGNQVNAGNNAITGLNAAYTGGSNDQAGVQAGINDNLANYTAQTTDQSNLLNNYWKIVGSGLGSSSTSSSTAQPNNGGVGGALSGAVGGATAGYGLYKNLKDAFGNSSSYDPSAYGFTSGYGTNGTQSQGATELQQMGFYNPLPYS